MNPRRILGLCSLFVALGLFCRLPAVTSPETDLTFDSATSTYTLSWYGNSGHTYFIQHSLDLMLWTTMPVIETGADADLAWSIQLTADRTFFRLLASSLPTGGNPDTADFDGDGINNITEISMGSNPISLDSDRDGMPDAWEYANGFNLTQPDATGNADGDTLSNLAEYWAGTDPNTADATGLASSFDLVVTSP
ncbi:MAG: hypothetical protein ABII82_16440 [Verrucomicrobiota bacterium]